MNKENQIVMFITMGTIMTMLIIFVNKYGGDALPYALGLGIVSFIVIYFIVKGVSSED